MFNPSRKIVLILGMVAGISLSAQRIPVKEPQLLPFPGLKGGATFFTHIPTQNLILSNKDGWTIADTLGGFALTADLELLRFRWGKYVLDSPRMDLQSSLGTSIFYMLGSRGLPGAYPTSFTLANTNFSGFAMNALIQEMYLGHSFLYKYSKRGQVHINAATGLTKLSLYKNGSGVRILQSSGLGLHLGVGWKTTLFGRVGDRVRIGFDVGYSFRGFEIGEQSEKLSRSDGSSDPLTPIESISFNTPILQVGVETGEWFFSAHSPYREPFRLGLFNMSAGFGLINIKHGVTIQYDTSGVALSVPFLSKISRNYDLQVFKYNWPFHFIKQADIDAFSGMGVRWWSLYQQATLPDGWEREFTDGATTLSGMAFSPRITDYYIDHELIYPLSSRFHAFVGGGTGYATMTLYENIKKAKLFTSNALTWKLRTGLAYTFQGDGSSLVSIGLSAAYYHQAFEIDLTTSDFQADNPVQIAPINYLDLSQPMIAFDVGLIFGGQPNAAQEAHDAFLDKKFSGALEIQDDFLSAFPYHHNKERMMMERQMIEDTLITHYYRDAHQVLSDGQLQTAYSLITQGQKPPTDRVDQAVEGMKVTIADRALQVASDELKRLNYLRAEEMILLALKSDPRSLEIAEALLARSYIIRATILYQSETYSRALFWLKRADGLTDRYKLVTAQMRENIGDGRLDDANEGILREDREMVYQSMEDAAKLNPGLEDLVEEHMQDLEEAMDHIRDETVQSLKRMAVDNLLDDISNLDPENFTPRVGMQGSVLATYVGAPTRKFNEGKYELWTYPRGERMELWLYLRNGIIEKVEFRELME